MKYKNMSNPDLIAAYCRSRKEDARAYETMVHHIMTPLHNNSNTGKFKENMSAILQEFERRKLELPKV